MTDLTISCRKKNCFFEMDWTGCAGGVGEARQYFADWNLRNADEMECVHDYVIRVKVEKKTVV